jgi:hypothetical protein
MKRRSFCEGIMLAILVVPLPAIAEPIHAVLYKIPQCSCCDEYAVYLRNHGFDVDVKPTNDLAAISSDAGVPDQYQGALAAGTLLTNTA